MTYITNKDPYLETTLGNVTGRITASSVGTNFDFGSGDGIVDLWDYDEKKTFNLPISAITVYVSSSNAGDNQIIVVTGLDENWDRQTGTATLNGQNQVVVTGSWFRIFSASNISATVLAGDIYIAESDSLTAGVPDTTTKVQGKIIQGQEITHNGIYTVPANKKTTVHDLYGTINKGKDAIGYFEIRPFGQEFKKANNSRLYDTILDTNFKTVPGPYAEKTDIKVTAETTNENVALTITLGFVEIDV